MTPILFLHYKVLLFMNWWMYSIWYLWQNGVSIYCRQRQTTKKKNMFNAHSHAKKKQQQKNSIATTKQSRILFHQVFQRKVKKKHRTEKNEKVQIVCIYIATCCITGNEKLEVIIMILFVLFFMLFYFFFFFALHITAARVDTKIMTSSTEICWHNQSFLY